MSVGGGFKVTVLCPTGHRVTVKPESRESPVLDILRYACKKRELDENRHRLKHHKTLLDNSLSIRFANLPNNATLDLIETEDDSGGGGSTTSVSAPIKIALQVGSNPRQIITVDNDKVSLHELVGRVSSSGSSPDGEIPVLNYMRREVVGEAELQRTTLRDLGIVAGGSAALRVLYKKPEALKSEQAHVPPTPTESKPSTEKKEAVWRPMKADSDITLSQITKNSRGTEEGGSEAKKEAVALQPERPLSESTAEAVKDPEPEKNPSESKEQNEPTTTREVPHSNSLEFSKPREPPVLHYLGASGDTDNNFVVFDKSDASNTRVLSELSEDFFDMTIDDVKLLYKDNKELLKNLDEGGELLTKGMREARVEGEKLSLLQKYKKCLVRIQFGRDGRVLQGLFKPGTTIREVQDSVRQFMCEPEQKFRLYTTPPKTILDEKANLLDYKCVPTALIHYDPLQTPTGPVLKPDLPLSNAAGVEQSVKESGVLKTARKRPQDSADSRISEGADSNGSNGGGVKRPPESQLKKIPDNNKIPKWLSKGKQ